MRLVKYAIAMALVWILSASVLAEAAPLNLTLCASPENDLYRLLEKIEPGLKRFDAPGEALAAAKEGSGLLILADQYPDKTTPLPNGFYETARSKNLRLYVEYPTAIPGAEIGPSQSTQWERTVVASDAFGKDLAKTRILAAHDCRFLTLKDPSIARDPLLVIARVAGYDSAVYGLPEKHWPALFAINDGKWLIGMTKLSNFVTGRYAPAAGWKVVWRHILSQLDPAHEPIDLAWTPSVRPSYGPADALPKVAEAASLKKLADWFHNSRLLIAREREPAIRQLLASGAEITPPASADEPTGDGSLGILEGYASQIRPDGQQVRRLPIRADCTAEAAMVLALDAMLHKNEKSRAVATNLLNYIYFTSGMCGGRRGDPKDGAYGLVAWGAIAPAWEVANYGDDNARVLLATILSASALDSDKWDAPLLRGIIANLRTTGTLGFRGDRIDMPALASGWKQFHDAATVNYAPHFESYLWACYLWAYRATGDREFLDRTKNAIKMTMEVYPTKWRWGDNVERARMLLCLAWLVRVEDTPEHRAWLSRIATDMLADQDKSGAIAEHLGGTGTGGGHYQIPQSNDAYGTGETPLIQKNGDPACDQLYTTGFALLALHEAAGATGDAKLKAAEDKLADFLVRIQTRSESHPELSGAWLRAFDFSRWDYWSSSADIGWGAWSIESGWGNAWIGAVFGLRTKGTTLWDVTATTKIADQFPKIRADMLP